MIIPPVLPQKDDPQIKIYVNVGRRKRGKKVSYELTVQIEPLKKREKKTRKVGFLSTTRPRHVGSRDPLPTNKQPLSSNYKLLFTPP